MTTHSSIIAWEITWREEPGGLLGKPKCVGGSHGKESAYNARDVSSILQSGGSPAKGMATLSSLLAWRIPWTEEPGRLQSMGSQRVRHD